MTERPHALGWLLAPPANIDTQHVLEEICWLAPAVVLELPRLAGCEDGHHAVPVFGLELLGAFHKDEAHGAVGVDVFHQAGQVQHRGGGIVIWQRVFAVLEEVSDVGHAEERRGGGREKDDGVGSSLRLLVDDQSRVVRDRCRTGLLGHEGLRELANV